MTNKLIKQEAVLNLFDRRCAWWIRSFEAFTRDVYGKSLGYVTVNGEIDYVATAPVAIVPFCAAFEV